MSEVKEMERIDEKKIVRVGVEERLKINAIVEVEKGSFLHIGGSPSPLTGKKAPIFMIKEVPAIPATSFKGALRYATEVYIRTHLEELKGVFELEEERFLIPCLPASNPTAAERGLGNYRGKNCEIKFEREELQVPEGGICPVCYLFGANGMMGFLRVFNFLTVTPGLNRMEQTNIRIDRKINTAAHGAIVSGDQVLPGTNFEGEIEIILRNENFEFGRPRKIGEKIIDRWLEKVEGKDLEEARLEIINNLVLKPLSNVDRLGGQKSRGGGKVKITVTQ
jgi:CRISPR/Cas system CSM-associated protein Csm3 (group 7 of RAMP superfamily)